MSKKPFNKFFFILTIYFSVANVAFANCPSCELLEKQAMLEEQVEVAKHTYEKEPTEQNLETFSSLYNELEDVNERLAELQGGNLDINQA